MLAFQHSLLSDGGSIVRRNDSINLSERSHTYKFQSLDRDNDDDTIRNYLRHMGNLPRLTHEEEQFYSRQHCRERREVESILSHVPRVLKHRMTDCRSCEIIEIPNHAPDELFESTEVKKERVLILIDALDKIAEHLHLIRLDTSEKSATTRSLLYQSLSRLISRFKFSGKFYQRSVHTKC